MACSMNQVVDFLVDKGSDVNIRDADRCTPLYYACYAGHVDTAAMLLYLGADPTMVNIHGKAAQDVACLGGNKHNREAILTALEVGRWYCSSFCYFMYFNCSSNSTHTAGHSSVLVGRQTHMR